MLRSDCPAQHTKNIHPLSFLPFVSQEIEKARKKMAEAEQEMKLMTMSSRTDFLTTIYIMNRQGESLGLKVRKVDDSETRVKKIDSLTNLLEDAAS